MNQVGKEINNTKILFLRPTSKTTFAVSPPFSAGYLAASLKKEGFNDLRFIDGTLHQYSPHDVLELLKDDVHDFICIQVYSGSHQWVKKFIELLHSNNIFSHTIVGGPHISALKETAMEHLNADYGIIGEGEEVLPQLIHTIINHREDNFNDIHGLIYKKNNEYKISRIPFAKVEDINSIPIPLWKLLEPDKYFESMRTGSATIPPKGSRIVNILTSRGCPYNCTFCASGITLQKKIRYRNVENIIQELEYLKNTYNIDEFWLTDDNFTMNIERAADFCNLLIEKKLKLHWRAPNGLRIDRLTEELIRKMKESGCYSVGLGVETGSPVIMKKIKKNLDLAKVGEILKIFRENKILTSGFFIVGLPFEKEKDIEQTIDFALKSKFDRIQVSIFIPYPGSEEFENVFEKNVSEEKYLKHVNEYLYKCKMPEINKNLSNDRIRSLQKKMLTKFYFRPEIILSIILNLRLNKISGMLKHPVVKRWFNKDPDIFIKDVE